MTLTSDELKELLAKATPGPWIRDCWDILGIGGGNGTGSVCCVSYPNGDDDQYWKDGEEDGNARLISLAPDLAAEVIELRGLLKSVLDVDAAVGTKSTVHDIARAALNETQETTDNS